MFQTIWNANIVMNCKSKQFWMQLQYLYSKSFYIFKVSWLYIYIAFINIIHFAFAIDRSFDNIMYRFYILFLVSKTSAIFRALKNNLKYFNVKNKSINLIFFLLKNNRCLGLIRLWLVYHKVLLKVYPKVILT